MADESYYRNLLRESVSALRQAVELDGKTAKRLEKIKIKIRPAKNNGIAEFNSKKKKLAGLYVKMLRSDENSATAGHVYGWVREAGLLSDFSRLKGGVLRRLLDGKLPADGILSSRYLSQIMDGVRKEINRNTSPTCYDTGLLYRRIILENSGDRSMLISDLGSELGHAAIDTVRRYKRFEHPSIGEAYDIAFNEALTRAMNVKSGIGNINEKIRFGEEYMKKRNADHSKKGADIVREIVMERKLSGKETEEGVYDGVACGMNGIPIHCVGFYIVRELEKALGAGYAKAMFGYLHEPKANMSDPQKFIDGVKVFGIVRRQSFSKHAKPAYA